MKPAGPPGRELGQAWRYDVLGYTFAFTVIVFAGVGYLLDRWFGTRPFLTVLGTLIGAGLAMAWVYLKVRRDEEAWRRDHGGPGGSREAGRHP